MAEIMKELKEDVSVRYYSSEQLPRALGNLKGLTREMFSKLAANSGGRFRWEEVDPVELARRDGAEKVRKYYTAKENGQSPPEPRRGESLEDLFLGKGKPKKSDAEILDERKKKAETIAREAKDGRSAGDEFRRLLTEEFAAVFLSDLQLRGIQAMTIPERGLFRTVEREFFSAIEIRYLAKEPEVISQHFWMGDLEFELAKRILKLARASKPTVVWFDGRKPPPKRPELFGTWAPPSQSEYAGFIGALAEVFDITEASLKENDTLDDVLNRIRSEPREDGKDDHAVGTPPQIDCLVVAQPHLLERRQLYEISCAVSEGIPTIFLVSEFSIDASQKGMKAGYPINWLRHGLDELFQSWGVRLGKNIVASRVCSSLPVPQRVPSKQNPVTVSYPMPICIKAEAEAINRTHLLTDRLPSLTFPAAVGLTVVESDAKKAGLSVVELANSGKESYAVEFRFFTTDRFDGGHAPFVLKNRELFDRRAWKGDCLSPQPLALLLEGRFPSPFQGKLVPEWESAK